jgi:hypothetical protein
MKKLNLKLCHLQGRNFATSLNKSIPFKITICQYVTRNTMYHI